MDQLISLRATAWALVVYVWALAAEYPAISAPLVGALVARLLKFRSPEEYARIASRKPVWLFSRVAAVMQLIPTVFPDTVKAQKIILEKILKGPPRPPTGLSVVAILALGSSLSLGGCAPAKSPRDQARDVVHKLAEGVRIGDETCASIAMAKKDLDLAVGCAAARLEAREALLIAEEGVDAWDAAAADKLPCAVAASARALSHLLGMVERAGGKTPPAVAEALKLAPLLSGACHG